MRALTTIRKQIAAEWVAIVARGGVTPAALDFLPRNPKILGSGHKTELSNRLKVYTAVVYMAPAAEAFLPGTKRTMCPWAGKCALACLGHNSGLLVTSTSQRARLWKTALFLGARGLFRELISAEIAAHGRKAEKKGMTPAVRIDGSTDTGYGAEIAADFPSIQFYDYTKGLARLTRTRPDNYHLTYSVSELSPTPLPRGVNWAVVFDVRKGEALPTSYHGRPVFNADEHDARFLDPPNMVAGLSFKAASDREGFKALADDFLN